ncbi:MAG: tRNA (adenosine(37)-N6)-threonylcarbamoyltransferase complex dimerization subunit type 1 TsaB [Deltaproteobacteria bacterium]|nr:tRNA (adenosine(37)-N6)-threonylcarbamoyltransferase complex dimerization subunit type 1 TsaB [Deltaproteobacteria bacterium]
MMLLAIDTSTDSASLALVQDGKTLAEATWRCGQNHSVELLPRLTQLLQEAKIELQSVSCILVAKGPGSFNGLRVGLSTAKGLAFSLDIPIIGVSSLELEACQHAENDLPICPIFNARREEIATALYQKKDNKWQQLAAEHITTVEALDSEITEKTLFCGEYVPVIAGQLKEKLKDKAVIAPARPRRASLLSELAKERLKAEDYDNPATLQPLYLRHPAITQRRHR